MLRLFKTWLILLLVTIATATLLTGFIPDGQRRRRGHFPLN
ncbi:hypothetical protein [Janthinobacterium sp. LB3P112]